MKRWLAVPLFAWGLAAGADETVAVCYNYGCVAQAEIVYGEARLREIGGLLALADSAESERALLGQAIGRLYAWAGEQSPVRNDRGGNYPDDGVGGRMDCIDHSTSTTRLLRLLEGRGMLRWHRVLDPQRRVRVLLFQHFSAVIEVLPEPRRVEEAPLPDYIPAMLALCDCAAALADIPQPRVAAASPAGTEPERFAVDSWFVDNGQPAVILPLADWLQGEGPDVE